MEEKSGSSQTVSKYVRMCWFSSIMSLDLVTLACPLQVIIWLYWDGTRTPLHCYDVLWIFRIFFKSCLLFEYVQMTSRLWWRADKYLGRPKKCKIRPNLFKVLVQDKMNCLLYFLFFKACLVMMIRTKCTLVCNAKWTCKSNCFWGTVKVAEWFCFTIMQISDDVLFVPDIWLIVSKVFARWKRL